MMVYCHDHSGKKKAKDTDGSNHIKIGYIYGRNVRLGRMTEMAKAMFTRTSMDESPRLGYTPGYSHRM